MARSGINKVILIGNLGQDPDVRYMPNGNAVANVSLATSESWKDQNTGETQERTEWHRVVFFRRLGEIVGEYCKKGSKIYIEGKLQTRKWQDKNGQDRYTTEIVADQMQMLDSRGGGSASFAPNAGTSTQNTGTSTQNAGTNTQNAGTSTQNAGTSSQNSSAGSRPAQGSAPAPDADFDDDIPF